MSSFPFGLSADPSRPALYALSRACAQSWDAHVDIVTRLRAQIERPREEWPSEAEVARMMESAVAHLRKVEELTHWIYFPKPLPVQQALEKAQTFRELGHDYVEDLAARLQKFPPWRPSKRRQSHIAAFEFMLLSKTK